MKKIGFVVTVGLALSMLGSAAAANTTVKPPKKADYAPSAVEEKEEPEVVAPLPKETISLDELPQYMREHNLTILACQAGLDAQKAFDREAAYRDIVGMINNLTDAAWNMNQMSASLGPADQAYYRIQSKEMTATADSLRKQLDSLKENEYEKVLAKIIRQTENTIQQIVMGAENLYISIVTTEAQKDDVTRALESMERTEQEMNLRYELGQISFQSLKQFQSNYTTTKNKLDSLETSIRNMRASLQYMMGEQPNGTLTLKDLPEEETYPLLRLEYDYALQKATENSFAIYQADETLADAKEEYEKTLGNMAQHTYQSAVYTHDSAIQSFQLGFRTLYQAILTAQDAVDTTQRALTYQEQNYAVAQVKYGLGKISQNALLTAKDDLKTAKAAVTSAKMSLFSAYHSYEWAVQKGIVPNA